LGLRLVAMTMTRRHSHLPRMYDMAIFHWKFGISLLYPSVLLLFPSRLVTRFDNFARVAFIAASSMALGLCPVLLLCCGRPRRVRVSVFVIFHDTLVHLLSSRRHVWNVTKVSSFVLSRTAVLYVIYHGSWWFIHQIMGTVLT
jgi:hypothetical protein